MPKYHGSLVAFEGPADVISTQLRLLPTSPQVLILPSIQSYLPTESNDGAFEPAAYIRRVHHAAATRSAAATSFLMDATPEARRLVFLHGGTPSAYGLCIEALAEHEARGDRQGAESVFRQLISSGLVGLSTPKPCLRNHDRFVLDDFALFKAQFEDPITRAMRAAEELDEQTAALQPDPGLAQTKPRPRSMSLPVYGYVDNLGDSAPFYVFGANTRENADDEVIEEEGIQDRSFFLQSPRLDPDCFYDDQDEIDSLEPLRRPPLTPQTPSCMGEAYQHSRYSSITMDDGESMLEAGGVVFGKASLVRMSKEIPRRSLKRVKSLDTATARRVSLRETPHRLLPTDLGDEALESLRRFSCVDLAQERLPIPSVSPKCTTVESPKTVLLKPARSARPSYVDRGTDAEGVTAAEDGAFQPILPFSEDLVLYFKDEKPDPLLDSVMDSFKTGTYPPQPPQSVHEDRHVSGLELLVGSTHRQSTPPRSEEDSSSVTGFMENITKPIALDEDYDPFAYDKQPMWCGPPKTITSLSPTVTPPTPTRTPSPPHAAPNQAEKITDFDTSGYHSAVALQNAVRPILEEHFPADNGGFHNFHFHNLPELGRLWKPIFKGDAGDRTEEGRTVDQIIAVGAQVGVKKEFVASVSRSIEMLGSDPSGALRSGRLDFRYLLANAMQSFTAQPLSRQTENPFTNPYFLATLIIPHLETYVAAHAETRLLLLEYPPDHLPTVLAIQRLVGVDLMKIVQVVDSSPEPVPFAHIRGSRIHSGRLSPRVGPANLLSTCQADSLPFTEANFLLTSSATEGEIDDFIDTVSRVLVAISPLYLPQSRSGTPRSPLKQSSNSNTALPVITAPSPTPTSTTSRISATPPSPARSDESGLTGKTRGHTPPSSSRTHFIVSSCKEDSPRRETISSRNGSSHGRQQSVESIAAGDFGGLGIELDREEKRLMPRFMGSERRLSSQKALKFLGLS